MCNRLSHGLASATQVNEEQRPERRQIKVGEYLEAGTRLVWVIDPRKRKATVHRSLSDVRTLGPDDALDGEDVLPGWSCPLASIL